MPLLCLLAWACGGFRRDVSPRAIGAGLAAMLAAGAALLHLPAIGSVFAAIGRGVDALAAATSTGTALMFGYLGGAPLPFAETAPGAAFVLFFRALPIVLLVGALAALLTHLRVLPAIVGVLGAALRRLFGLSGAATLSVAANVFLGQTEAPLLIRPWLARLPAAELLVVMTAGLATISGNMLVVYAAMLVPSVPDAAGQLLAASLVAAPAAIVASLLLRPAPPVADDAAVAAELPRYDGALDALVRGTADGLQLLLAIMASLIVFVALVALANMVVAPLLGVTLQEVAGWAMRPLAWCMGVPAAEVPEAGRLLGLKLVLSEFVAYLDLSKGGLSPRSTRIVAWALCGFTNLGSLGIMLGGLCALCPERRAEIVRLGLPSLLAATIACCMAGAVAGLLTPA